MSFFFLDGLLTCYAVISSNVCSFQIPKSPVESELQLTVNLFAVSTVTVPQSQVGKVLSMSDCSLSETKFQGGFGSVCVSHSCTDCHHHSLVPVQRELWMIRSPGGRCESIFMKVSLVAMKYTRFADVSRGSETSIMYERFNAFCFFLNVTAKYPKESHPY